MNTTKRYNVQTGFPFQVELPAIIPLTITKHAEMAAENDRYGRIMIENYLRTDGVRLVEFETDGNFRVSKIVVRKSYNRDLDIVYVIGRGGVLVTCWLNEKSDGHKTLDKSRVSKVV